jgi:hypothetical protein
VDQRQYFVFLCAKGQPGLTDQRSIYWFVVPFSAEFHSALLYIIVDSRCAEGQPIRVLLAQRDGDNHGLFFGL